MKVEVSAQVRDFLRTLPPEPRKALRDALHGLERERGDLQALEGDLSGFLRLRVSRYRVVCRYISVAGQPVIRCEFAEARSIVYQLFAELARQTAR